MLMCGKLLSCSTPTEVCIPNLPPPIRSAMKTVSQKPFLKSHEKTFLRRENEKPFLKRENRHCLPSISSFSIIKIFIVYHQRLDKCRSNWPPRLQRCCDQPSFHRQRVQPRRSFDLAIWMQNSSFWIQNSSMLMHNPSLWIQNPLKNDDFRTATRPFFTRYLFH